MQDRYVLAQILGITYIQTWAKKRVGGIYQYISWYYESATESASLLSSAASLAINTNEILNLSTCNHSNGDICSSVKITYFFRAHLVFHGCLYNKKNGVTVPFTVYPFVKN